MSAVVLEHRTRTLVRVWTSVAVVFAGAALTLALSAGGNSEWTRIVLGAVCIGGLAAASRYRVGLHIGVVGGVAMLAVVPVDAVVDRGLVAGIGAILIVTAAESAHVARRLITTAPVSSTWLDARAMAGLVAASVTATALTAAIAQLDEFGGRATAGIVLLAVVATASIAAARRRA
jgi:hypothetical protein